MPFTAVHDGDIVYPDDVPVDAIVECPECGDKMHVRKGHTTRDGVLKPRCFAHNPGASVGGMCSGGESDDHKLMKYVVTRRLQRAFEHGSVNREVGVPGTERIGDVVVDFESPVQPLGNGVVAEVQYRNDDKDIQAVTQEYLKAGYSVYWLRESHFGDDLETVDFPEIVPVWPQAVPMASEWGGVEGPVAQLKKSRSRYPIDIQMPREFFDEHSEVFHRAWRMGSGDYDFDLVRALSENNATRSCDVCGDRAGLYLFDDGVMSAFRCSDHLPESVGPGMVSEPLGEPILPELTAQGKINGDD